MGIDYGLGITNTDHETGIRYGILPRSAWPEWMDESLEAVYFHGCGYCGSELSDSFESPGVCPDCGEHLGDGEDWSQEPIGWRLDSDGYEGHADEQGDLWITKSPYKCKAGFCSPCAPGAVYLTDRADDAWGYCLGPDWYENSDKAMPYDAVKVA